MNEWKPSVGRITLFPTLSTSTFPPSALEFYRKVWGGEPDNFQKQANPLMPTVAMGKRGSLMASCSTHPTRIDFSLTPPMPPQNAAPTSLPLIEDGGQLHAELESVVDFIRKGPLSAPIVRVALSAQFLIVKSNFAEANEAVTKTIPNQYGVRTTNEEDLIFQINRPYTSNTADGVRMNSITKWSVDRHQVLTFLFPLLGTVTTASANRSSAKPQIEEFIAGSVTFDNNNVQRESALSSLQQSAILLEALAGLEKMQRDIGLNIEAFQNAKLRN
jgi:hypothetical protein